MAQTAIDGRRVKAVGAVTELVAGVLSVGSNGATTLDLSAFFSVVQGVICSGSTEDAVAVATSISGATVTFDSEQDADLVAYIAFGLGLN